jgi:hypothetical protein
MRSLGIRCDKEALVANLYVEWEATYSEWHFTFDAAYLYIAFTSCCLSILRERRHLVWTCTKKIMGCTKGTVAFEVQLLFES